MDKIIKRVYKLTFRVGKFIDDKLFEYDGGLNDAIARGRKHCDVMGFKFITVRPGIVNLDHQENLKLSDPEYNPLHTDETRYEKSEKVLTK